jgi:intein/homing endonuclease
MSNEIVTKYKKLTKSFLTDTPSVDTPQGGFYKAKDKQDYETKKLERQQSKFLKSQWQKVKSHIQQKSLIYESQRYPSYLDYELMEHYPIIGQALDILMEESTTPNKDGKILNIYSESKRVEEELRELFYNRLNIHTNLPMWIRNMPIRKDSMIPIIGEGVMSIEEVSNRVKSGDQLQTYAVQAGTGNLVSGKIVWCDLTRKNSKLIRVTLSDDTFIDTTPDHEYLLKNGDLVSACDLMVDDVLMTFKTTSNENVETPNEVKIPLSVKSVISLDETDDVFCMEVQGFNGEHDRHNFPICSKNEAGGYSLSGVFVSNCKYGDNFVYLQIHDEYGIVGAKQLANIEVERVEGTNQNGMKYYLQNSEDEVIFRWKATDIAEFKYWQIAHFRLLVDDRKIPYGVSVLEKARRIWKNLLLVEDAMRTIRLFRAIDRRIYYVNVGNIDPSDVQGYVEDIASRFKRKRHIDPATGQEDLKFNVMGVDQDIFIPIREKDDGTRVDTLAGSSNVSEIADIEYDLNQLFAALGIPKPFLQYEDTAGEGKNLAMQDIRFSRKINRIQQAALQELNKIAMVHLLLIGLDDELHNFELTLNNPSTQSEMMRTEHNAAKISAFKDAVSDANGKGIAAMSVTEAMKEILGKTDEEIKLSLQQQFMERVMSAEIDKAAESVSTSTLFDSLLKLYGTESTGDKPVSTPEGEEGSSEFDSGGGGGGGGGFGGFGEDLGSDADLGLDVEGEEGLGTEGGTETLPGLEEPTTGTVGGAETEAATETPETTENVGESFENHKKDKLITEKMLRISDMMKKIK